MGKISLIIAGTRDFDNYGLLVQEVDKLINQFSNKFEIVSGCARGADKLGERYAKEKGIPVIRFPAEWNRYGLQAGILRNEEMAKYADMCIVFWDNKSKGTKNMISNAYKYNLPLKVVLF